MLKKNNYPAILVVDETPFISSNIEDYYRENNQSIKIRLLDDQEDFLEELNHQWDIVVYGNASCLSIAFVLEKIETLKKDLVVIRLQDELETSAVLGGVEIISPHNLPKLFVSIQREINNLNYRRKLRLLEVEHENLSNLLERLTDIADIPMVVVSDGVIVYHNSEFTSLISTDFEASYEGDFFLDFLTSDAQLDTKDKLKKLSRQNNYFFHSQISLQTQLGPTLVNLVARVVGCDSVEKEIQLFLIPVQSLVANKAADALLKPVLQLSSTVNEESKTETIVKTEKVYLDPATNFSLRKEITSQFNTFKNAILQGQQAFFIYLECDHPEKLIDIEGFSALDFAFKKISILLRSNFPEAIFFRYSDFSLTILTVADRLTLEIQLKSFFAEMESFIITIGNKSFQLTLSGCALLLGEMTDNPEKLVSQAHKIVSEMRSTTGNGHYQLVVESDKKSDITNIASENDSTIRKIIEDALEQNLFSLIFEPVYNTTTGGITRFDVSAELKQNGKSLSIGELLPWIKKFGFQPRFDRWLLINVSRTAKAALRSLPEIDFSLTLSNESLQDASLIPFIGKITKVLGVNKLPLILKFYEEDMLALPAVTINHLRQLAEFQCRIAMKDYTGHKNSMKLLNTLSIVEQVDLQEDFADQLELEEKDQEFYDSLDELRVNKVLQLNHVDNAALMTKAWTMGIQYLKGTYLGAPVDNFMVYLNEHVES